MSFVLFSFYTSGMAQRLIDPALIDQAKEALAQSPGWARVGLTCSSPRLREEALTELAGAVVDRIVNPPPIIDSNQLRLL